MGHYTEIHVAGHVQVSHKAEPVIRFLFSAERTEKEPETLPDHRFFRLERWRSIGVCSSYYLSPIAFSAVELGPSGRELYFHSVSNLKNYDGEIEAFFEWLKSERVPHYGHIRDEDDEGPEDNRHFRRVHSYGDEE